jgi:hypothetical protein
MKMLATLLVLFALVLSAGAQDKPRVFVQGKGSENLASNGAAAGGRHWASWGSKSTLDSHDESMEVTKDLQKNCSSVIVTLNQANADYTVMLNRESKQNRGLLRSNNQLQVANRAGDILGTSATHTVGNAAKDACELILGDWQAHGQATAPASSSAVPPAAAAMPAASQNQPAPSQPDQPQPLAAGSSVTGSTISDRSQSQGVGEASRQAKQHKACLELAKDNPSITCN